MQSTADTAELPSKQALSGISAFPFAHVCHTGAHATTGLAGLALLTLQSLLPAAFSSQPAARTAHALLGSAILALFAVHAVLGIQLGLAL